MPGPYDNIDDVPQQREGDRASASLLNLLIRAARRKIIIKGPGVKHLQTGVYDIISIAQGAGAQIEPFAVYEEFENYLRCRRWSWTDLTAGVDDVSVAKPYLLRSTHFDGRSITNADGESVQYTYTGINERTLTFDGDSSDTEDQTIIPKYNPQKVGYYGDIIWAVKLPPTGAFDLTQAIVWQDVNLDGRAWAEVAE